MHERSSRHFAISSIDKHWPLLPIKSGPSRAVKGGQKSVNLTDWRAPESLKLVSGAHQSARVLVYWRRIWRQIGHGAPAKGGRAPALPRLPVGWAPASSRRARDPSGRPTTRARNTATIIFHKRASFARKGPLSGAFYRARSFIRIFLFIEFHFVSFPFISSAFIHSRVLVVFRPTERAGQFSHLGASLLTRPRAATLR